ncbi:MAG: hypothetical protein IJM30_02315 [Thermoguttaceae bacterium]|nr:hypothetical protein [Thermoguttaceae bacterium]
MLGRHGFNLRRGGRWFAILALAACAALGGGAGVWGQEGADPALFDDYDVEDAADESGDDELANGFKRGSDNSVNVDESGSSLEPFDLNATSLEPGFKGNNLKELSKKLIEAFYVVKDKFETSEQFNERAQKRVAENLNKAIYGNVRIGDYVAFVLKQKEKSIFSSNNGELSLSYNSEKNRITILYDSAHSLTELAKGAKKNWAILGVETGSGFKSALSGNFASASHVYGLVISQDEQTDALIDTYYAQALKALNVVSGLNLTSNELSKALGDDLPRETDSWTIIDVPSSFAKKNLDSLAVCCVGKLGYFPTVSLLNGNSTQTNSTLVLTDVQFWVYNTKTGELTAKFLPFEYRCSLPKRLGDLSIDEFGSYNKAADRLRNLAKRGLITNDDVGEYSSAVRRYAAINKKKEDADRSLATSLPEKDAELAPEEFVAETWEDMLEASGEPEPRMWEKSAPRFTVSDAGEFFSALKKAKDDDVIRIKKGTKIDLDTTTYSSTVKEISLRKGLKIVGETGNPRDVSFILDREQYFEIKDRNVWLKGVTIKRMFDTRSGKVAPAIKILEKGDLTLANCALDGGGIEGGVGILTDRGVAKLWKCGLTRFTKSALAVQESGKATLAYCELTENGRGTFAEKGGTLDVSRCRFVKNNCGFKVSDSGGGKLEGSFFEKNANSWSVATSNAEKTKVDKETCVEE